jgi:predicted ArsR family transcriptional regulator
MLLEPEPELPSWTFLTNHAHVLVAIGRDPGLRQRDIAHLVGITPGAVTRILADLEATGCITHERVGRRNRYHVNRGAHLRHPLESDATIGQLIQLTDTPSG